MTIDTVFGWCVSESARDFRQAGFNVVIAANATNYGIADNIFFSRLALRRLVHKKWGGEILQPSAIYKVLLTAQKAP